MLLGVLQQGNNSKRGLKIENGRYLEPNATYNCLWFVRVVVRELRNKRRFDHRLEALVRLEQRLRTALDEQL